MSRPRKDCGHDAPLVSVGKGRLGCSLCRKEGYERRRRAAAEGLPVHLRPVHEPEIVRVDPDSLLRKF